MRINWRQTTALILISLASNNIASAAPSCSDLRALLVKAQKAPSNPQSVKRYSQAIKQQTKMIAKVTGDLRRYNCEDNPNLSSCKKLTNAYHKMQANLSALQKKRSAMANKASDMTAAQIRYKLDQKQCGSASFIQVKNNVKTKQLAKGIRIAAAIPSNEQANPVKPRGININAANRPSGGKKIIALPSNRNNYGNYRTLCVRTCDGYYFPISSHTSSKSFARDEYACQLMCPGTNAQLYYHDARNQESEDMISYRGAEAYASQSFAFSYRTRERDEKSTCTCNISAFHAEMTRREALLNKQTASLSENNNKTANIAVPSVIQDPAEDPETLSNLRGQLDNNAVKKLVNASENAKREHQSNRKVRLVGPAFIPDEDPLFAPDQQISTN